MNAVDASEHFDKVSNSKQLRRPELFLIPQVFAAPRAFQTREISFFPGQSNMHARVIEVNKAVMLRK